MATPHLVPLMLHLTWFPVLAKDVARRPKFWVAAQVIPRSGSFRDMSAEIEVELSAFSITVLGTAPDSDNLLVISEA